MTPLAPVKLRNLAISSYENMSPDPNSGILISPLSIIFLTINHLAGTYDFSTLVLGWTEIKSMSASFYKVVMNFIVLSKSSRTRILHEIDILWPKLSFKAFIILVAFSKSFIKAAPMPPEVENFMGQPMFTSTPQMSSKTS